jgi:hypothetical protein
MESEKRGRKNGLWEVLEIYDRETRMLHVLGGRRVLLLQQDWPFWHQQYPFVSMSLAPFPFSIQGLSLVEKLAPLQSAYWDLLNQTLRQQQAHQQRDHPPVGGLRRPRLVRVRAGAVNTVDRPDQVKMWQPEYQLASLAAPLMEKLQGDIQNLAMGQPLVDADDRPRDRDGGRDAVADRAERRRQDEGSGDVLAAADRLPAHAPESAVRPRHAALHQARAGRQPRPVLDPAARLPGRLRLRADPVGGQRDPRRAPIGGSVADHLAIQAAPVWAMAGTPLNLRAFSDKVLDAFDIDDKDEFYSAKPQHAAAGAPGGGGPTPRGSPGQAPAVSLSA